MTMASKPPPPRLLAIDYGLARLGLALSDERQVVALPYKVMQAHRTTARTVALLIEEIAAMPSPLTEIVIGLPLLMNGSHGLLADEVKHFAEFLRAAIAIPIVMWDERLTSVQAERSLREGGLSRKKRTKHVDTVAAVIILQSYLNYKNQH